MFDFKIVSEFVFDTELPSLTVLSQVTFKYEKKKKKKKKTKTKKSAKKRQSSQDLRLLGWRLNPALPGALSTTLQERMVTAKTMFNMIQKTVQGGDCQMQRGGE